MKSLYTEDTILIKAPATAVWEILIDPKMTVQYMFGCEVICSWKTGGPIIWKGAEDGIEYVKGTLVKIEKPKTFAFTVFDPNGDYDDIPENYLTATYTLTEKGNETLLKVTQGDYAAVAEGERRYKDSLDQGGWSSVLEGIRNLAESAA